MLAGLVVTLSYVKYRNFVTSLKSITKVKVAKNKFFAIEQNQVILSIEYDAYMINQVKMIKAKYKLSKYSH